MNKRACACYSVPGKMVALFMLVRRSGDAWCLFPPRLDFSRLPLLHLSEMFGTVRVVRQVVLLVAAGLLCMEIPSNWPRYHSQKYGPAPCGVDDAAAVCECRRREVASCLVFPEDVVASCVDTLPLRDTHTWATCEQDGELFRLHAYVLKQLHQQLAFPWDFAMERMLGAVARAATAAVGGAAAAAIEKSIVVAF